MALVNIKIEGKEFQVEGSDIITSVGYIPTPLLKEKGHVHLVGGHSALDAKLLCKRDSDCRKHQHHCKKELSHIVNFLLKLAQFGKDFLPCNVTYQACLNLAVLEEQNGWQVADVIVERKVCNLITIA